MMIIVWYAWAQSYCVNLTFCLSVTDHTNRMIIVIIIITCIYAGGVAWTKHPQHARQPETRTNSCAWVRVFDSHTIDTSCRGRVVWNSLKIYRKQINILRVCEIVWIACDANELALVTEIEHELLVIGALLTIKFSTFLAGPRCLHGTRVFVCAPPHTSLLLPHIHTQWPACFEWMHAFCWFSLSSSVPPDRVRLQRTCSAGWHASHQMFVLLAHLLIQFIFAHTIKHTRTLGLPLEIRFT